VQRAKQYGDRDDDGGDETVDHGVDLVPDLLEARREPGCSSSRRSVLVATLSWIAS
jgi:hypothetical protein